MTTRIVGEEPPKDRKNQESTPPPIGIMPEFIWRMKRADELHKAIYRYMYDEEGRKQPELIRQWFDEMMMHIQWIAGDEGRLSKMKKPVEPENIQFSGGKAPKE